MSSPVNVTQGNGSYKPSVNFTQTILFDGVRDNVDELMEKKGKFFELKQLSEINMKEIEKL